MVERHLPGQAGKVHRGEELGLFFLNLSQRFVRFFELDRLLGTLLVEESKVLHHSVAISMSEAEQRGVEH